MKKVLLLSGSILLLQAAGTAQKNRSTTAAVSTITKETIERSPFSRNIWEYTILIPNVQYNHQNIKTNDIDQGSQSQFALDLGANYYVADHIGIGVELLTDVSVFKSPNNSKSNNSSWMTFANLTYGTTSGNDFNFYARAGIGLGGVKNKYTPATGNAITDKSDLFGYKLSVGFPIQLNNGVTYFTPEFGYRYQREKFAGGTETDNRFGVNLKLETFLFCKEMQCDSKMHHAFSSGAYDQGRSYLGVSTSGMVGFGNLKTAYDNNFPSSKETYSLGSLDACYKYYVVRDLALGAGIEFGNSVYKNGSNSKSTNSNFLFMPMVELNIPSDNPGLSNLFIMGGYGVGMQKNEFKNGNNTSTVKYSSAEFCAGLGYNFFFHKGLSFTPTIGYDMSTLKNKTTDIKTKYSGIELEFGIRKFF
jgi:opacity protein-like surface antigen